MANYTEKAIFRAFEELLEEKPFDKITVSAIVSKSEVSEHLLLSLSGHLRPAGQMA